MASKQDFTPDEWTKLLESAMAVGAAVSAADPSGLWGTFQEFLANSGALDSSKLDPTPMSSLGRLLSILGRRRVGPKFETRCIGALTVQKTRLTAFSARSTLCGLSQQSLIPRLRAMHLPSRRGFAALVEKWQRLLWRAASSVLAVSG
jgi:hypothetical protein